ncbi:hypothetical protein BVI2075_440019 [Burkholderia vietnamiensis]|nr:hypothetical protein BVI1335_180041 [Burkholderia vietnamiensis]CAG9208909.1 hypothetical protein BVI2075_440019 [Burkholderia vietnamiensis]
MPDGFEKTFKNGYRTFTVLNSL